MVCISVKKEPVIGVIHKPFESKSTYWAWVDHGYSSNLNNYVLVKITLFKTKLILFFSYYITFNFKIARRY